MPDHEATNILLGYFPGWKRVLELGPLRRAHGEFLIREKGGLQRKFARWPIKILPNQHQ